VFGWYDEVLHLYIYFAVVLLVLEVVAGLGLTAGTI
jgi:hypothetical protein